MHEREQSIDGAQTLVSVAPGSTPSRRSLEQLPQRGCKQRYILAQMGCEASDQRNAPRTTLRPDAFVHMPLCVRREWAPNASGCSSHTFIVSVKPPTLMMSMRQKLASPFSTYGTNLRAFGPQQVSCASEPEKWHQSPTRPVSLTAIWTQTLRQEQKGRGSLTEALHTLRESHPVAAKRHKPAV